MSFDVKSFPKPFNIGQSDSFKRCTTAETISFGEPSGISPDISTLDFPFFYFLEKMERMKVMLLQWPNPEDL